jgi:inorganic pyrophosphatase
MVFVEIPARSRNKYEFDPERGRIVLDRMLLTSTHYPADYGFIEGTQAPDGDALDALVLVGEPTFPGCSIRARVVGIFLMDDQGRRDDKIICVPLQDPMWSHVTTIDDLPSTIRAEIQHFFSVYKELEGKRTTAHGFSSREDAVAVIEATRRVASHPASHAARFGAHARGVSEVGRGHGSREPDRP